MGKRKGKIVECDWCGKQVYISLSEIRDYKHHYCKKTDCWKRGQSKYRVGENAANWGGGNIMVNCSLPDCNKEFGIEFWNYKRGMEERGGIFFCTRKCEGSYRSLYRLGENAAHWTGESKIIKCSNKGCSNEILRHKNTVEKNNTGEFFCSLKCKYDSGNLDFLCLNCGSQNKKHKSFVESTQKLFCHNECRIEYINKNRKTPFRKFLRAISLYREIRDLCFIRDNYISVLSGENGLLEHHHLRAWCIILKENKVNIDNWEDFVDDLFDVENVVTLTKEEHRLFHKKYGYSTTPEQFNEFRNNYLGGI